MDDNTKHPALALFAAGFTRLVPIAPPGAPIAPGSNVSPANTGKIPMRRRPGGNEWWGMSKWQNHITTLSDIEQWIGWGAGFGLLAETVPCIDIDIDDAAIVERLLQELVPVLDTSPLRRTGRAPRVAIPCRPLARVGKTRFRLLRPDNTEAGVVEVLGAGQQWVIAGIHPKTNRPYSWTDGTRIGDASMLAERGIAALPEISPPIVDGELAAAIERAAAAFNLRVERAGNASTTPGAAQNVEHLRAPSMDVLREAVNAIPNDSAFSDRTQYIMMLYAIKASAGPDNEPDGEILAIEWAMSWTEGVNVEEKVGAEYRALTPSRVGWEWIATRARPFRFDDAAADFGPTLPPTPVTVASATLPTPIALPTSAERMAALHGFAARAFLYTLPDLHDGEFLSRWASVLAAAGTRDPLADVFREVRAAATRLSVKPDEQRRFEMYLNDALEGNPCWAQCTEPDRVLLRGACFALITSLRTLSTLANDGPGNPMLLTSRQRDDLVEGLIPSKAVVALVGAPGQGKSFVALELAARVASDPASAGFAGRETKRGRVLYFASEDADGITKRVAEWSEEYGNPVHLHVFGRVPALGSLDDTLRFVLEAMKRTGGAEDPPLRLIVIDVLRAAIQGDENASDVVGPAMVHASIAARMTGAAVLLVHHAPKSDPEQGRGSSAFTASMDLIGAVSKIDDDITLKVVKNKSARGGDVLRWHLNQSGVLCEGGSVLHAGQQSGVPVWARAVANIVGGHGGAPVTRRQISDVLATDYPQELSTPESKRPTVHSRVARSIREAVRLGWVQQLAGKTERYTCGPEKPDVMESPAVHVEATI